MPNSNKEGDHGKSIDCDPGSPSPEVREPMVKRFLDIYASESGEVRKPNPQDALDQTDISPSV